LNLSSEKEEAPKKEITPENLLLSASLAGDVATVQTLLSSGVSVNCKGEKDYTALHNSTRNGHTVGTCTAQLCPTTLMQGEEAGNEDFCMCSQAAAFEACGHSSPACTFVRACMNACMHLNMNSEQRPIFYFILHVHTCLKAFMKTYIDLLWCWKMLLKLVCCHIYQSNLWMYVHMHAQRHVLS
jgi:hypothetical protein